MFTEPFSNENLNSGLFLSASNCVCVCVCILARPISFQMPGGTAVYRELEIKVLL